ncbi:BTAD domain-containing putative transcriptional regulator [Streptomyces boninensis]|uniref:AfsR/SARP family transcriptional regulator n=1 Tax=Streptomyces boninensis TaxID=2039455 RepID=UPI003B21CD8D
MLATLLIRSNEVVSVDGLIDELWGDGPPRTAMTTLQVYVSQLRKMLPEVVPDLGREALLTRSPGYVLRVDPRELDLSVFEELHHTGREALEQGEHARAADLQRRALDLWRGPLLSDTPHGSLLHSMSVRLSEVRIAALEQRIRAELQLGHHQELLGELQSLCAELPMHEEFHAHLMVALYRAGRQADALQTFSRLRRTLVDELAIEPGRRLQQLHSRILTGDPGLLRPAAGRATRQDNGAGRQSVAVAAPPAGRARTAVELPAFDPLFTGRTGELDRIAGWMHDLPGGSLAQLTGPAGAGKTALAVAAAHRARETFPDGRVLISLRAADGRPLNSTQVMARLLTALGAPQPLPVPVAELRDIFRQLTESRRLLMIFDDAPEAAHLRPLLPLPGGCVGLITCRAALPGLGGHVFPLDALSGSDARLLLAAAAGRPLDEDAPEPTRRPAPAEPDALAEIEELDAPEPRDGWAELAALCGGWPGLLRAAGARLAAQRHWSAADLADRLQAPETRLAELRGGDEEYCAAVCAVYDAAPEPARQAARLLSLLPPGAISHAAAACALGTRPEGAERTLRSLVAAGLLGPQPGGRGFQLPEPIRLCAAERRAQEEPTAWERAAVARLCAAAADHAATAQRAARMDGTHPLDWFARREGTLVDLAEQAHSAGLWSQVVRLADALTAFFEARASWDAWQRTHTLALEAAERSRNTAARVRMLRSLGDLAWQRHRPAVADDLYRRALEAGGAESGRALAGLADIRAGAGAYDEASRLATSVLGASPEDARGCYEARRVLALLALDADGPAACRPHFQQCLDLAGTLGDRHLEAYARRWLSRLQDGRAQEGWREVRPGVWRTVTPRPDPLKAGERRTQPSL